MSNSNDPILNKLFQDSNTYIEKALDVNKEEYIKVVESRRSVRIYSDEKVLESDMLKCLELSLLSANSSNLQPWEFYWVRDLKKKERDGQKIGKNEEKLLCIKYGYNPDLYAGGGTEAKLNIKLGLKVQSMCGVVFRQEDMEKSCAQWQADYNSDPTRGNLTINYNCMKWHQITLKPWDKYRNIPDNLISSLFPFYDEDTENDQ